MIKQTRSTMQAVLLACSFLLSDTKIRAQAVEPGQHLPAINLAGLHRQAPVPISKYNRTPLIIAFWSPTCHASVRSLALMDSLQIKYAGRLQFLAVNRQDKDATLHFFRQQNLPAIRNYPFVSNNPGLEAAFPHKYFPWHVWVDQSGTVRYITGLHNLTERNIERFLAGEDLPVINRKEPEHFDPSLPLIAEGNGRWLKNIPMYIYTAHCDPNLNYMSTNGLYNKKDNSYHYYSHCASITTLLVMAFSEKGRYHFNQPGRVRLRVKDTAKYRWPDHSDELDFWRRQNAWSFEMKIPAAQQPAAYQMMQQYLSAFFDLDVKVEKAKLRCLALVRRGSRDKLKTRGGTPSSNIARTTADSMRYITNLPFSVLAANLRNRCLEQGLALPFVDATGYRGNIDFAIKRETFDKVRIPQLRKELRRYDLDLVEKDCLLEVLVISEKQKE